MTDIAETIARVRELDAAATAVPGFPGYFVTPDGEVFSTATNWRGYGARSLSQVLDTFGYPYVRMLDASGARRKVRVHRMMARIFIGPRPSLQHQVRHLDGCKQNNAASNLAWGTALENAADRERHGRTARGDRNGMRVAPKKSSFWKHGRYARAALEGTR